MIEIHSAGELHGFVLALDDNDIVAKRKKIYACVSSNWISLKYPNNPYQHVTNILFFILLIFVRIWVKQRHNKYSNIEKQC